MSWFKRDRPEDAKPKAIDEKSKHVKTEGLWQKCDGCRQIVWKKDLAATWNTCPKCGHHFRMDAVSRIRMLLDGGEYKVFDAGLGSTDPLGFVDSKPYGKRLEAARLETGLRDAVIAARGKLGGREIEICSMEARFIGGSMGAVVGEKITRAIERALKSRSPLVIVSASGGARMQEGASALRLPMRSSASRKSALLSFRRSPRRRRWRGSLAGRGLSATCTKDACWAQPRR